MHTTDLAYGLAVRAAPIVLQLAAPFSTKLRRSLAGRRDALSSMQRWAEGARQPDRALTWLHAPSVGEALMTQAILAALREREPTSQFIFTYFSPSAERVAERVGADWSGYLPWDRKATIDAALDAVQPTAVAFVRSEVWPMLTERAHQRGAHVSLVNAVLREGSSRLRAPARSLLGRAYRALDAIGAVSADDAARFGAFGVAPGRVHVTGDARFDQVWQRVHAFDTRAPLLRLFEQGGPWLVAGSTWPADEEPLVHALIAARAGGAAWRAVIAPHEPTDIAVRNLERRLLDAGLRYARLPADGAGPLPTPIVDVVVVDRMGVLADLYAIAAVAYVGGGFGGDGLHSVVEPAALGVPVVFGPRHGSAQEAQQLVDGGGAFVAHNGEELQDVLRLLRRDTDARTAAAAAARDFVKAHIGGADRNAALLARTSL